jgi:RNA polymerase sigma-70 factor (ECF subfamily)
MDEATLLAALSADLDLAFESLVRARQDRLYSIALRILGDPSEAEDAAQDAFIRAYRALGGWDAERIATLRLDAWLATIVVNVARTRFRRRGSAAVRASLTFLDELDHPRTGSIETPHGRLAGRESVEAWAIRLLALPERYRAPIVLRHVDGLGYDEIAIALERPQGTVKAQVHRGLALLRAALEAESRADPTLPSSTPNPTLAEALR